MTCSQTILTPEIPNLAFSARCASVIAEDQPSFVGVRMHELGCVDERGVGHRDGYHLVRRVVAQTIRGHLPPGRGGGRLAGILLRVGLMVQHLGSSGSCPQGEFVKSYLQHAAPSRSLVPL